jgi:hypothetical protein
MDVCIHAQVRVHPQSTEIVKMASGVTTAGPWSDVDVVDLSMGGLGFATSHFLPRGVRVLIRLINARGEPVPPVSACVQRVVMTDRRPSYIVGCAFDGQTDQGFEGVEALLREFLPDGHTEA